MLLQKPSWRIVYKILRFLSKYFKLKIWFYAFSSILSYRQSWRSWSEKNFLNSSQFNDYLFQCLKYNSKINLMTCFKHRLHSVICNRYLELKAFYSTLQSHLHLMHLNALRFLPGYVLTRGNLLNNSFSKLFNDS